ASDPTYLFVRGDEKEPAKEEPLAPAVPAIFAAKVSIKPVPLSATAYYPGLRSFEQQETMAAAEVALERARQEVASGAKQTPTQASLARLRLWAGQARREFVVARDASDP